MSPLQLPNQLAIGFCAIDDRIAPARPSLGFAFTHAAGLELGFT
jgi:hypothetical protein